MMSSLLRLKLVLLVLELWHSLISARGEDRNIISMNECQNTFKIKLDIHTTGPASSFLQPIFFINKSEYSRQSLRIWSAL